MMFVVYVESSSTVHVLPANILAMIALYVSCTSMFQLGLPKANDEYSEGQLWTLFSYGTKLLSRI